MHTCIAISMVHAITETVVQYSQLAWIFCDKYGNEKTVCTVQWEVDR